MIVLRTRWILAVGLCLFGTLGMAAPATQPAYEFNLPQQALAESLRAIGRQTTLNIMFEPQTVESLTAPPLRGRLSAEEAIRRVLSGTRLVVEHTAPNSMVVAIASDVPKSVPPAATRTAWKAEPYTRLAQADAGHSGEDATSRQSAESSDAARSGAEAAKASESQTEVVVTGSRIARPDLDRLQPTLVISSKSFDERGYTDAGQALSELPAFGIQPVSAANTQASFGIAQSFVDFYALGSQRTLTLVNGRRFVSANTPSLFGPATPGQQVDLNVIPTKLIDRIETISVGGAPIYGSDAIAGTVNIILKQDYEGLVVDGQAGVSDRGDAESQRIRVLGGTNFFGDRANVTVVGEYSKAHGLVGSDRRVYAEDLGFLAPLVPGQFTTVLTPDNRVASISTSGIPMVDDIFNPFSGLPAGAFGVTGPNGELLAFAPNDSNLVAFDPGLETANPVFREGGDGLGLATVSNLLSPIERKNLDLLGHLQLTDSTRLFAEAWFSETDAKNLLAQPAYNSAFFGSAGDPQGNLRIKLSNPFLPQASRALIADALAAYQANPPFGVLLDPQWSPDQFYLARANLDLQSGRASANQRVARGVVGIAGSLDFGSHAYGWEIAANYGRSHSKSRAPSLVFQNFLNALDATIDPGSGDIVCAASLTAEGVQNAPTTTLSSECAPINVFGAGSPSQASRDYITHIAEATSTLTQRNLTASINGGLFGLPAGEVKAALGFEYRRESASFNPDSYLELALGTGAPITGISGAFHTNEVFGELLVPIVGEHQEIPLIRSFQFEGAVRYVDNSVAGTATTWTAGFRWSPIDDLQFRGNKTRSIRAPAITELFLPTSQFFTFANDPCDATFLDQGTAPATRAANCAAEGIPTDFTSNIVNASATASQSGNADLKSESADARTIGVVIRPRWVPNLNVTADYIDIELSDAIESLSATDIMDACYDATDYPSNESCARIDRDAGHQVAFIRTGYVNAGLRQFTGIASAIDYTFNVPAFGGEAGSWGAIELRANHLATTKLISKVGLASPNNLAGELTPNSTIISKGSLSLDYRKGPLSWYWQGQFTGSTKFDNNDQEDTKDVLRVHRWWLFNSTVSYDFSEGFTTRLIVNNVFDKKPPFASLAGTGGNFANATSQYFSGILGRSYLLAAEYRF